MTIIIVIGKREGSNATVVLLQQKAFEMYKLLSSKSGLIKELLINEDTYVIIIKDLNGHEMKKSALSAGEKENVVVNHFKKTVQLIGG